MSEALCLDVDVVAVEELHSRLGFPIPIVYPETSRRKPLTEWRMEDDDAPILRYIYRHFRPRRHLEFGTWQGTGTLYVLEECGATVWTVNLLEGELMGDGAWAYSSNFSEEELKAQNWIKRIANWNRRTTFPNDATSRRTVGYQTDSLGFIGRYYLEQGLGHRVCQIYCDSRKWDITQYPSGFFDTCLVDGGHQSEVVSSDTLKAVRLVRSEGLVMWHDFCPVSEVIQHSAAARGVVSAIKAELPQIRAHTKDLFWVKPSHILLGVRA